MKKFGIVEKVFKNLIMDGGGDKHLHIHEKFRKTK